MNYFFISLALSLTLQVALAQPSEPFVSSKEYIERWKDEAIAQMVQYKIPSSITLAQGLLESGYGNSELAKYANNHFGIKCHDWDGARVYKDDDKKDDCFRKYTNALESFEDHSKFLTNRKRYSSLFLLERTDYKGWAKGLKKAGYATNPKYATMLIDLIEKHELYKYDKMELLVGEGASFQEINLENNKLALPKLNLAKHAVQLHFKTKYVEANRSDTYYQIAKEFDLSLWQLHKYNDCDNDTRLNEGDRVYLQPKRNKVVSKIHLVELGETMRSIAQQRGVKLKKLYKKNNMILGVDNNHLIVGQQIRLR